MDSSLENYIKTGDQLLVKGKSMDCIREYLKGYEATKNLENDDTAEFSQRISSAYMMMGKAGYDEAKSYGEISLHIHEKLDEQDMVIMDLLNLSSVESGVKKNAEAEAIINRALEMSKAMDEPVFIAMCLNSLAGVKGDTKRGMKEALSLYEQVLTLSKKNEDWDDYFEAMTGKLRIVEEENGTDAAIKLGREAMDLADELAKKIKNKKERKLFKESIIFLYDSIADMAMSVNKVDLAIEVAQRSTST